jgi:hypothetical protein
LTSPLPPFKTCHQALKLLLLKSEKEDFSIW